MNPRHHPFPLVGRWLLRLLLASAAAFGFGAAQAQAPAGLALMAEVGRQAMDDPLAAERQVRKRLATQRGAANTETAFWLQLSLVDLLVQTDREADSRRELAVARSLLPQGPSARGHHLWLKFYERFAQPGPVEMAQFQATQALARDEARAVGDEQLLCALQMHEAVVQVERDAVDEAWAALERVDQCATRQADAALQAYALGTMGPLAARVGAQGEQPQAYYQRALRALGEMPARFRRAWLLDDLAWAQFKAGETAAARRGFEQVLALSSEIADVSGVMRGHEGMAEVLLREKDAEGALRQARLALAQARAKEGLRFRLVTAQTQVVEALAQLGRLAELAPEIDSLRAMTAQDPSPHTAVLISRSAARGLRALGRHAEAYQELEQFVELTATDQRQQRERDAQRLQARYDAVRRDAENKELRHAAEVARLELDARNQRQRALWALVATLGVALAGGGAYFARALRTIRARTDGPAFPLQRPPRLRPCAAARRRRACRSSPVSASALIGRNGAGKSSLLKILAGLEKPDDGAAAAAPRACALLRAAGAGVHAPATVFDAVSDGVAEARALRGATSGTMPGVDLDACRRASRRWDGWTWEQRVDTTLQRWAGRRGRRRRAVGRHAQARGAGAGAGGRARRAAARRADQPPRPRRHRVAAGPAGGLQGRADADHARPRLHRRRGHAHRRARPRHAAQLPRATSAPTKPPRKRELAAEALANARADKLLAQEEVWIRKGVEARRTRSVGRVAAAGSCAPSARRGAMSLGQVRLESTPALPSGKIVAELNRRVDALRRAS
jgi:energy-coupling factor transporter ATP-binding protein EcfA2